MSVGIDFSQPQALELGRTPSQPSLTNTSTTASDSDAARPHIPTTPPMPSMLSHEVSEELARREQEVGRWGERDVSPSPPLRETFTERASKRLSLSRSLLNLRDMAKSDKARRRASSMSEKCVTHLERMGDRAAV
jgi:hypothetical protein